MLIAAASSGELDPIVAVEDVVAAVLRDLGDAQPDLAYVFASRQYADGLVDVAAAVQRLLAPRALLGCTCESVVGSDPHGNAEEFFARPALTVWAASLPGVDVKTAWIQAEESSDGYAFDGLPQIPAGSATMLILAEPFSFPAPEFVRATAAMHPELSVLGGMASGGSTPGQNRLIFGGNLVESGAVAVVLSGALEVHAVVSQGCRAFGKPLVVTRCRENVVFGLGGKPALAALSDAVRKLDKDDRDRLSKGLHLGCAVDSARASDGFGDYLMRNVVGAIEDEGAVVIGDEVRLGQTVQFHLRDPKAASDELKRLLRRAHEASRGVARGALLFTCNGRGPRMFDVQSHDAVAVQKEFGRLPVAGFFANGEIGPVGRESYLHGFTAVTAIFAEARPDQSET